VISSERDPVNPSVNMLDEIPKEGLLMQTETFALFI
jgi:hypothetical protein